ncbi:hypothetical protein ABZ860_32295 [Microbispora sp. NPDC046973]|uniref:hypothetical protein n=1 Tax=Microbispora sp. NPDC046973 TaxID=3155022 RepID=UPI0033F9369B
MVNPAGPIMAGGFETVTLNDAGVEYSLVFLPDKHNDELQAQGANPVFYWLPERMRLARKPNGDLRLSFLHFLGVQDGQTNLGVAPGQTRETSGGVLSFAMTGAPPEGVLRDAHKQILERMQQGSRDRFWQVKPGVADRSTIADIRPIPIRSSTLRLMITDQDGTQGGNAGDPFFVTAQGAGNGSLIPTAEHPFVVNLGTFAAAQVEQGLLGTEVPIAVTADLTLPLWAPITRLHMTANWERVFSHFTAQANASWWWSSVDLKATWNTLRMNGDIKVELEMDRTIPGADNKEAMVTKYIDMLVAMWLDQAKQVIFQPMPEVQDPGPPKSGGLLNLFGWGFGAGFNLNFRQDRVEIANSFTFEVDEMYAQPSTMGGNVDGVADLLAAHPELKSRYLRTLYLDNWERKITTVCRPVIKWPDPDHGVSGDPVKFASVQIGYPGVNGEIAWSAHDFLPPPRPQEVDATTDVHGEGAPVGETTPLAPASSATLVYASGATSEVFFARQTQKKAEEVAGAPEGWRPDKVFVRRTIQFDEAPSALDDRFSRIIVEANEVDLDPGPFGTLTDSLNVAVRADNAGALVLAPISINRDLTASNQIVEVQVQPKGEGPDGGERPIVTFTFTMADTGENYKERRFALYTGQPGRPPAYRYRARVIIKGTLFEDGDEWIGPWTDGEGSGDLSVRVPKKTDPGVTVVSQG